MPLGNGPENGTFGRRHAHAHARSGCGCSCGDGGDSGLGMGKGEGEALITGVGAGRDGRTGWVACCTVWLVIIGCEGEDGTCTWMLFVYLHMSAC